MKGLYAIVDTASLRARSMDPMDFARAVLDAGPAAIQLRAKDLPPREIMALLRAMAPLCRRHGVPLVANDRPDLAALAGCNVVHVGQGDMPVEQVRRIAPGLGVGVSTHTAAQITLALALRPAYVAFGPVYPTQTRHDTEPVVGLEGLGQAATLAAQAGVPLVAIGGITLERVGDVAIFADAAAIISGLYPDEGTDLHEVTERARLFHQAFHHRGSETGAAAALQ